jgi:hypothetical protein
LFTDAVCQINVVNNQAANGSCQNVNFGGFAQFGGARYTSSNQGAACNFNGTYQAQGALDVTNAYTVCCR